MLAGPTIATQPHGDATAKTVGTVTITALVPATAITAHATLTVTP